MTTSVAVERDEQGQWVRLPNGFEVSGERVYFKKTRLGFLVLSRDPWDVFLEGIEELDDDCFSNGRSLAGDDELDILP